MAASASASSVARIALLRRFRRLKAPRSSFHLRPAPFIVGAPRSGTTLLRLMLDAHPSIAIPAETGFFAGLATAADQRSVPASPQDFWRFLTSRSTWPDFGLNESEFRMRLDSLPEFSVAAGLRSFYQLYAAIHGKTAWGDKTPSHCHHMPIIQETLPEAHFIHIIRDGRDTALSLREVWFAPGRTAPVLADFWATAVRAGRSGGAQCKHYLEVRYEALVRTPRETLETICEFLSLPFSRAMLNYHQTARDRLSEATDSRQADGRVITIAERLYQQRRTSSAPDIARIGRWRTELSANDFRDFDATAGDLLEELGYSRSFS